MIFELSERTKDYQKRLIEFMERYIYPNEKLYEEQLNEYDRFSEVPLIIEDLKKKAKSQGLWNLFLTDRKYGAGLTNLEYAFLCEIMGRSSIAPEVFNCSAPDTGNMEVLVQFGTEEQKE